MTLPPKHAKVLAYVNRIRAELGLCALDDLMRGELHHGNDNPLSRSIRVPTRQTIYVDEYVVMVTGLSIRSKCGEHRVNESTPLYVAAWIERFDAGLYPEYEANG